MRNIYHFEGKKTGRDVFRLMIIVFFSGILSSSAFGQDFVLFDGESLQNDFSLFNNIELDATEWSPNSNYEASVKIDNGGWNSGNFWDNVDNMVFENVDLVNGTFTIDYKTNDVTHINGFQIQQWSNTCSKVATVLDDGGKDYTPLTADGQWHTLTIDFNEDWSQDFYDCYNASDQINPRVALKVGTEGVIWFDHVKYTAPPQTDFSLTVENGTGDGTYQEGDVVNIDADLPAGYTFDQWTGDVGGVADVNAASTTITMPASDVNLTASYTLPPQVNFSGNVTASGHQDPNVPGNTVDDDMGTRWGSEGIGEWIQYEFSALTTIYGVDIAWYNSDTRTYDFRVLGSTNGSDWTELFNGSSELAQTNPEMTHYILESADVVFLRVEVNGNSDNAWAGFHEIDFYGETAPLYTLSVTNGSGSGDYGEGQVVEISADAPASGKIFDSWSGDTGYLDDPTAETTNVTMPAQAVNVTANYRDAVLSTLTVEQGSGSGDYYEGEEITIEADAPSAGDVFDQWTGDVNNVADLNASSTIITMPAADATVTATYQPVPLSFVSEEFAYGNNDESNFYGGVATGGGIGWGGNEWQGDADGFVYKTGDIGFETKAPEGYVHDPEGYIENTGGGNSVQRTFEYPFIGGQAVWGSVLVAASNNTGEYADLDYIHITFNGNGAYALGTRGVKNDFPDKLVARLDGTDNELATSGTAGQYETHLMVFKLEINQNGSNDRLNVWIDPDPAGGFTNYDEAELGTPVGTFDSYDIVGEQFTSLGINGRWGNGKPYLDGIRLSSYDNGLRQVLTGDDTFALDVIDGSGSGKYNDGDVVDIAADVSPGKEFAEWTGDVANVADVNAAATTVTMPPNDVTLTATFNWIDYTLTVNDGTGGGTYNVGDEVNISANAAPAGMEFNGWSGDTEYLDNPSSTDALLTMPASNVEVTATYRDIQYDLTVTNGVGDGQYPQGEEILVMADGPAYGQEFDQWTSAYGDLSSIMVDVADPNTTLTMPAEAIEIVPTYKDLPRYTLTVENGTGGGEYFEGQVVNIEADAPGEGEMFAQWIGDTDHIDDVNAAQTSVTMPAEAIEIVPTYKDLPRYTLTVENGTGGGEYFEGQVVTIEADAPGEGEMFAQWSGDTDHIDDVNAAQTSVTMPGSAVTVAADIVTSAAQVAANEVRIFPNPVSNGVLRIISDGMIDQVMVIDLTGSKVLQEQNVASEETSINVGSLTDGQYLLKIVGEDGNISVKQFIKR